MRYEKPKFVVEKARINKNAPSVNPGDYCVVFTGGAAIVGVIFGVAC
ncbi:MAG: hypothetical protein HXS40_06255 [Theionarchaea archaeon]|nr:hypothetical protein [Theionarchaea archaeon]